MSQRPEAQPGEELRHDAPDDQLSNPLSAAAEAAAEKSVAEDLVAGNRELEQLRAELEAQKAEHAAVHDKYVRLHAEFDNFRKRTAKERLDLLLSAGADTIKSILPVLDDMERAMAHNAEVTDIGAVKKGFELIHQKFSGILAARGVKPMEAKGQAFDPELQEAISQVPAPSPDLKGKVLDVVETGYLLNDKVLRYAKVVVGQ